MYKIFPLSLILRLDAIFTLARHVQLKIMPILLFKTKCYQILVSKPLLSGQAPLSGHLPVPRGWPRFVQTVRDTLECIPYSVSLEYDNEPVVQKTVPVFEVFTMVNLSFSPVF